MLDRYHCCASCQHFFIDRTSEGIVTKCARLGYDTKPAYQFNCWNPKERVRQAMENKKNMHLERLSAVIDLHVSFYQSIVDGEKQWISVELEKRGLRVLSGFTNHFEDVRDIYRRLYPIPTRRIVLCGINPGRLGAGKTGVPFLDFMTLSDLFSDIDCGDNKPERSAQFLSSVIQEVGRDVFFEHVYLSNLSWYGFSSQVTGNNVNYSELPPELQSEFTRGFIEEMRLIEPSVIIPLSETVERDLLRLHHEGYLPYRVADRLPHPYFCSFKNRYADSVRMYVQRITESMPR